MSFRFQTLNNGSTLRINPVSDKDNEKSLWCNLLIFDAELNRWRPQKTIRHFLYVGEGKMALTPKDFINLGEGKSEWLRDTKRGEAD